MENSEEAWQAGMLSPSLSTSWPLRGEQLYSRVSFCHDLPHHGSEAQRPWIITSETVSPNKLLLPEISSLR